MKKMIIAALAALFIAVPAVQAQKVNKESLLAKIAKSDVDIADAKKNVKASTWISRGNAFFDAAAESTKNLFIGVDGIMMKMTLGEPTSAGKETVKGVELDAWVYPYFTVYIKDGKVLAWKQTQIVLEGAPMKAIEAYNKAFEVDPKSAEKVKTGLKQISDYCVQLGSNNNELGFNAAAADAYMEAYAAQSSPAYGEHTNDLLYFAGCLRTFDGSDNPASFPIGADYLSKALELGYTDETGEIYYYLFHCLYGQRETNPEMIIKAKDVLLAGIAKFPKNERILEGLMQLYTSSDNVGNPADLIALIDESIKNNPENIDLWFGRSRIFYALKDYDQSIASALKVTELKPELFDGNYFVGLFYIVKGDELNKSMNDKQYSSESLYNADLKSINDIYLASISWLEKAHQIKPDDTNTIEYLKSVCFRLRDEPGVGEKYALYNALYKKLKGEE